MSESKNASDPRTAFWQQGFLPFGMGILLAIAVGSSLNLVPPQPRLDILALVLAAIGAVYVGSALVEKQVRSILLEALVALACIILALLGLWVSPGWVTAGYVLHGIWDFFHHSMLVGAPISQRWYPPLCVGFDWAIAVAVGLQYASLF